MQHRAENGQRDRKAQTHADNADMLQAVVGEQPLHVGLNQDERRRHAHGEQTETQNQMLAVGGPQAGRGENAEPQQGVEGDFERHAGEHGAGGRGRFAVGVGQPGVHGRQARLGAVTDQREHKGQLEQARVQLVRHAHQIGPVEAGQRLGVLFLQAAA